MSRRFRPAGDNSFWGDSLYEMVVPPSHFLRRLRDLLDWEEMTQGLAECYRGGAEYGPIPYHPAVLVKMLFLSYLYDLSERQTEEFASDSMAARYFLGLGAHQSIPDHSTLTVFKERVLSRRGAQGFDELFQRVVRVAKEKGIRFGRIQVVDATHSVADVDVKEDEEHQDQGSKPRDGDAAWGTKGKKRVKTTDGKSALVNKFFYGYKTHLSLNADSGLISAVVVTEGNQSDGKQLTRLMAKDEAVGVEAEVYAGDKAYDDGDNHEWLRWKGKSSALCLKGFRTKKYPEGLWAQIKGSDDYQEGQRQRYKIEQKNAEAKRWHGLRRCRYLGLAKYAVQALMTALAVNLKRMVWLLYGERFRGAAWGMYGQG